MFQLFYLKVHFSAVDHNITTSWHTTSNETQLDKCKSYAYCSIPISHLNFDIKGTSEICLQPSIPKTTFFIQIKRVSNFLFNLLLKNCIKDWAPKCSRAISRSNVSQRENWVTSKPLRRNGGPEGYTPIHWPTFQSSAKTLKYNV